MFPPTKATSEAISWSVVSIRILLGLTRHEGPMAFFRRLCHTTQSWYEWTTFQTTTGGYSDYPEGGIPMSASKDKTAAKGLRGWWASPPRPGLHRLINPWEYRHLRASGVTRIAGGSINVAAGVVCLAYRTYRWAAFFLLLAALNLAGGYWYLTIDRSASTQISSSSSTS